MSFYVYCIMDPNKQIDKKYLNYHFKYEPIYIGKGSKNRINEHLYNSRLKNETNYLKVNKLNKILKSNKEPIIEVIEYFKDEDKAFELEVNLIRAIGKIVDNKGSLCNITDGGEGRSGCDVKLEKNPFYGKKHSKESLNSRLKPVLQYDMDGNIIAFYESLKEASIRTNSISSKISNCCKGYRKSHNNYKWEFVNKEDSKPSKAHLKTKYKYILQKDLKGNLIKRWNSISEIVSSLNIQKSNLIDNLKGRKKTCGGYIWEYYI